MKAILGTVVVACMFAGTTVRAEGLAAQGNAGGTARDAAAGNPDAAKEFALGLEAMSKRDLAEAATHFQKVIASDPLSFEAHNNLAVIYWEQGKNEEALAAVQRALKLRPKYYRGRKNLAELYARLANLAFLDAAEVAPPDERPKLLARAASMVQSSASSPEKETGAARRPEVAAAETAAAENVPAAPATRYLLALGEEGGAALEIRVDSASLYKQQGEDVRLVASYPVEVGDTLPPLAALYVPRLGGGAVSLLPMSEGGPPLRLISGAAEPGAISLKQEHLEQIKAALQPLLTPVLFLPEPRALEPSRVRAEVGKAFKHWHNSWAGKELEAYVASYVANYDRKGGSGHDAWKRQRARIFARSGAISVEHSSPVILQLKGTVFTLTRQEYRSKLLRSSGVKLLTWVPTSGGWKISAERMLGEKSAAPR